MAPAFGRSISFPLSPSRSSSTTKKQQARHVRSISLPTCRAHPLLAHLHATTRAARAWSATADPSTSTPSAGLAYLDALHAALADLLALPEPRAALATSASSAFSDRLLDALLALADAHGAFRETLLDVRRHAADARAALRRRDSARLASAARAQRGAEKDLARLASAVRAAARLPQAAVSPAASVAEVEVSGVLAEALAAAASASAAVFSSLESVSSAATAAAAALASSKKPAATLMSLVTRTSKATAASDEDRELAALEKMEQLDECVAKIEAGSDKVFRSILHTRVALLNIRTQTC